MSARRGSEQLSAPSCFSGERLRPCSVARYRAATVWGRREYGVERVDARCGEAVAFVRHEMNRVGFRSSLIGLGR